MTFGESANPCLSVLRKEDAVIYNGCEYGIRAYPGGISDGLKGRQIYFQGFVKPVGHPQPVTFKQKRIGLPRNGRHG